MNRSNQQLLAVLIALGLSGCASMGRTAGVSGFMEQLYKNSDYKIGQVVEINNELKQVEITYDPIIPAEEITIIDGWNISEGTADSVQKMITDQINKLVTENVEKHLNLKLTAVVTDVKTSMVPKYVIFKYLQGELDKYPELRTMISNYLSSKRKFDVITQVITARVTLSVITTTSSADTAIPPALLRKINTKMNTTFVRDDELKLYESGNIVIGIISDPLLVPSLLSD